MSPQHATAEGDAMTPDEAIAELIKKEYGWSRQTLEVWRRAGFKCEYCTAPTDLLASSDAYFRGAHLDHIVPGAGDHIDNLALACAACNYLKRGTDPSSQVPGTPAPRNELIAAARRIVEGRRTTAQQRLAKALPFLEVLRAAGPAPLPDGK